MNLKRRLSKEVSIVGIAFGILLLFVTFSYFFLSEGFDNVLTESEPTLDALNRMLVDVYEDHILLMDYLQTTTYGESTRIQQRIDQGDVSRETFEKEMEQLIAKGDISTKLVIDDYYEAFALREQVQAYRDQLIALHRTELESNVYTSSRKGEILKLYTALVAESTQEFQRQIQRLEEKNNEAKQSLLFQSRLYVVVMLVALLVCVIAIVVKVRAFSKRIIEPVDITIEASKQFVDGDYDVQISPTKAIDEIGELQSNINAVFKAVNEVAKSGESQKKSIQRNFLKKEYVAILDLLGQAESEQKKVTMSDVKKALHITHPTALSRVKFLEEKGYVRVEKEGRDKCLFLEK